MPEKVGKKRKHDISLFPQPDALRADHYYYVTQRPWPSLVFVLPMLLIFEVLTYTRQHAAGAHGTSELVAAWLIERLVQLFGASGFYFPGLLVLAILLAWHVASRQSWRFDLAVLPGMLGESLVWTLPLFVFNRVLHTAIMAGGPAQTEWTDQIIRSLGAGIYEELVFRLICITALVILLIDVFELPRLPAGVFIVFASAMLFAAQHHPPLGAERFDAVKFTFRSAAGLYLAGLFIFRGFGIAAGTHAFYNVIVVTIDAVQS
jgi:hypothetical protein